MPLLKGETLDDRLKREGKLPLAEVLRIGRETAEGLAAAHAAGLVHRDIKPGNLWLEGRRQWVKVLDFGLARAAGQEAHLTQPGMIVGTPAYMAPEQAKAEAVDARSDLFSLGCVLYRLATGELPFKGSDAMSVLLSLAMDAPRPPRELNPEVPPALNNLILRLLAKDPAQRPVSAEVVARVLDTLDKQAQAPGPVVARAAAAPQVVPVATPVAQPVPRAAARPQALPAVPASPAVASSATVATAAPTARPAHTPRRFSLTGRLPLAVAAALLFVLGLGAIIAIRLTGGEGTVTIETVDPDIEVAVKKDGKEVVILDPKTRQEVTLKAGAYEVEFKKGGGGLKLEARNFTLKRGDKVVVKVTWDPGKVVTNSIGMKLVLIPPGKFTMGSPKTEAGRDADEEQHEVEITRPFYMGAYEVTQQEYQTVMGTNPSSFAARGKNEHMVGGMNTPRFPVENVSWKEAVAFCKRLSERPEERRAGRTYRLPTEAEWEYACRAGKSGAYGFDEGEEVDDYAWVGGNAGSRTNRVGLKKPNAWGLYDMHGNVWEWCADWYGPYPHTFVKDPTGPATGARRVLRGGSGWEVPGKSHRAASRGHRPLPGGRDANVGFRVVCVFGGTAYSEPPRPGPGKVVTNSIGMRLVPIPPGKFTMGSPKDEPGREGDEEQHEVEITRPLYMGVTEVTQEEYEKVMGKNQSAFSATGTSSEAVRGMVTRRFPVEQVSWNEAVEFCKKLSELPEERKAGRLYRLPTEAEWEYACRAGEGGAYGFDEGEKLDDYAWHGGNAGGRTHQVGTKKPNAWGLYDMHGNVFEWCLDWYAPYPAQSVKDPTGPATGENPVLRGGCWHFAGHYCRAGRRHRLGWRHSGFREVGFRVVCDVARAP
jgi:formylglycine-generating enzyme required for sulfatase activity